MDQQNPGGSGGAFCSSCGRLFWAKISSQRPHALSFLPRPPLAQVFWGMAFNKLRVFELYQYRKIIWMDSDTMVFKNMDHLMKEPMFTGESETAVTRQLWKCWTRAFCVYKLHGSSEVMCLRGCTPWSRMGDTGCMP